MRSHIMKERRREQREKQGETMSGRQVGLDSRAKGKAIDRDMDNMAAGPSSSTPTTAQNEDWLQIRAVYAHLFLRNSTWVANSARLSERPTIESTISALSLYKGKVTPHMLELMQHCKTKQRNCSEQAYTR
jgi:hypothetical protein